MVFFGPTDPKFFGYPENINLSTDACMERCEWLTDDWTKNCARGLKVPVCMSSITVEMAFIKLSEFLDGYFDARL